MRIHYIGFEGKNMAALLMALHKNGVSISGSGAGEISTDQKNELENHGLLPILKDWGPHNIKKNLDAVILGNEVKKSNPWVLEAKTLKIPIFSFPEFLYEHSKHKTRVVIGGAYAKTIIIDVVLHVLKYHGKEVDYALGQTTGEIGIELSQENDFIVLEDDQPPIFNDDKHATFHVYRPNIALLTGIDKAKDVDFGSQEPYVRETRFFIDSIVKGGILVYNEEDLELRKLVEESTNTIRKHPYRRPKYKIENGITFLVTPEGDMPLESFGQHDMEHLAGAKWICQHLGVDEDGFYEAIALYGPSFN